VYCTCVSREADVAIHCYTSAILCMYLQVSPALRSPQAVTDRCTVRYFSDRVTASSHMYCMHLIRTAYPSHWRHCDRILHLTSCPCCPSPLVSACLCRFDPIAKLWLLAPLIEHHSGQGLHTSEVVPLHLSIALHMSPNMFADFPLATSCIVVFSGFQLASSSALPSSSFG